MDLYRFFDASGRLLYIGISLSAVQRAARHRQQQPWWDQVVRMEVEHFPGATREELERIERDAIRAERPLHNVVHAVDFELPPCRVCGRRVRRHTVAYVVVLGVRSPPCDLKRCLLPGDITPSDLASRPAALVDHQCNVRSFPCARRREEEALQILGTTRTFDSSVWWVEHLHDTSWPVGAVVLDVQTVLNHFEGSP